MWSMVSLYSSFFYYLGVAVWMIYSSILVVQFNDGSRSMEACIQVRSVLCIFAVMQGLSILMYAWTVRIVHLFVMIQKEWRMLWIWFDGLSIILFFFLYV